MSQPNVAVARRWIELFNGRDDVGEFLSLHDPDGRISKWQSFETHAAALEETGLGQ